MLLFQCRSAILLLQCYSALMAFAFPQIPQSLNHTEPWIMFVLIYQDQEWLVSQC